MHKGNLVPWRYFGGVVIALLLLVMFGCTNTATQVGPFSQAVDSAVDNVREGYALIDESTVQRKIASVAADPDLIPDDTTFTGLLTDNKNLTVRIAAMNQLQAYASALGELSSADYRQDIDKAAKNLYGSLSKMKETYAEATNKELEINNSDLSFISTAIDAIGTTIVEAKRQKALRRIIKVANPAIQETSELLKNDMPKFGPYVKANLQTVETEMIKSYQRDAKKLDYPHRVARIKEIQHQHEKVKSAEPFFTDIGRLADKIGQTHGLLLHAAEKKDFSIPELAREIGDLTAYAKTFQNFNKSLLEAQ